MQVACAVSEREADLDAVLLRQISQLLHLPHAHSLVLVLSLPYSRLSRLTCTLPASSAFTHLIFGFQLLFLQERLRGSASRSFCGGITSRRAAIFRLNAQVSACIVR